MLRIQNALSSMVLKPSYLIVSWTGAICKDGILKVYSLVFCPNPTPSALAVQVHRRMVNAADTEATPVSEKTHLSSVQENIPVTAFGDTYSQQLKNKVQISSPMPPKAKGSLSSRFSGITRAKVTPNRSSSSLPASSKSSVSSLPATTSELDRPHKSSFPLPPIPSKSNSSTSTRSEQRSISGALDKRQNESMFSGITSSLAKLSLSSRSAAVKQSRSKSLAAHHTQSCTSIQDLARNLKANNFCNIILVQGAGVSTGSGIPDFRSKGTGLYSNLSQYNIPYPEAIFDIDFFRLRPKPFYTLARELYPSGKYKPNVVHYFARLLHEKQLLMRLYTQNIDGLERLAGIPPSLIVEAHGTFSSSSCIKCGKSFPNEDMKTAIFAQTVAKCHACKTGLVKPDITFFGEDLPKKFFLFSKDLPKADLVIVMGTSLEVEPFSTIISYSKPSVPRLLINRDKVGPFKRSTRPTDICMIGELESSVWDLIRQLGWTQDLKNLMDAHGPTLPKYDHALDLLPKQTAVEDQKISKSLQNGRKAQKEVQNGKQVAKPNSVIRAGKGKIVDDDISSVSSTSESTSTNNSSSS